MAGAFTVGGSRRGGSQPLPGLRGAVLATLLLLAVAAWVFTGLRMRGMDEGPGTALGSLGFYITVWVVMMAAMMFPSIAPMVLIYARVAKTRQARGLGGSTGLFVAGYLVTWSAFGLATYALFALVDSADLDFLAWDRAGRYLAGGVLLAAAIYQLTPAKDACLRRCRGPLEFVLDRWRDGGAGALRMGIEHGAWCVGCCWALMASLFALGLMSVPWMAFIAALIAAEKTLPWRRGATYGTAAILLVLALLMLAAPDAIPALKIPGGASMSDMGPMRP
jgi:predicted metal-binding membrane protein